MESQSTGTLPRFKELQAQPLIDRRFSQRIRQPFAAEISEWLGTRAGRAMQVRVQDMSTIGVGIVHAGELKVGGKYMLEIPRPGQRPLAAIFTVVRSSESAGGLFETSLEPDEILDVTVRAALREGETPPRANIAVTCYVIVAVAAAAVLALRYVL
jgi:hypothetical protein